LGNISTWRRNKPDAKQLLGYLPIIKSSNITEKRSQNFKNIVRETFHKSLEKILEPLMTLKNGLDLTIENKTYWFFPKISAIIADWPKASTFCLTYKSSNSNNPCHFCLVTRDNLANINLSEEDIIPRTHKNMKEHLQSNSEKLVSIESVSNIF
jgi:Plavaka transposase